MLDDDTVYFVADVADLSPTFGDPLGAQLFTLFVRDPSAAETSTAPFYASRNYTVAEQDAWSRALQVRGFAAPRFIRPDFSSAGDVSVQANAATGQLTIVTSTEALGGVPGPGWTFTLSLDPADAPFTMDTIPPPGVEQEVILDATLGPVELRGVTIG